jgi:hypothetical protein
MKPELKLPGINLYTLNYDEPLSTFAFKLNLRRYNVNAAQEAIKRAENYRYTSEAGHSKS